MSYKFLISFVFLLFMVPLRPTSAKIVDQILVIINDDIITQSDLEELKRRLPEKKSHSAMLDLLIEEKLTEQLTKKLNLSPTEEEVEAQINKILSQQGITKEELVRFLKERGMTIGEYRDNMKKGIERNRLLDREIKSNISIKEEDTRSYYYSYIKPQKPKKRYHIRQIFFSVQSPEMHGEKLKIAQRVSKEGKKGTSFESLFKKYAEDDVQPETGGDLGFLSEEDLIPPLRNAVKRLKVNGVSKPITTKAGIHVLQLLAVKRMKKESYTEAKDRIHTLLYEKEFAKILKRWLKSKKEEAYIKNLPLKK